MIPKLVPMYVILMVVESVMKVKGVVVMFKNAPGALTRVLLVLSTGNNKSVNGGVSS